MRKWKIEFFETKGCAISAEITSPAGRTAQMYFLGGDGRLSEHRTEANVEFSSENLKFTESIVDKVLLGAKAWVKTKLAEEPEFALKNF